MLQSQAPIRKLTGCKGVRKESGLWKSEAARAPVSPLRRAAAGRPETGLQRLPDLQLLG